MATCRPVHITSSSGSPLATSLCSLCPFCEHTLQTRPGSRARLSMPQWKFFQTLTLVGCSLLLQFLAWAFPSDYFYSSPCLLHSNASLVSAQVRFEVWACSPDWSKSLCQQGRGKCCARACSLWWERGEWSWGGLRCQAWPAVCADSFALSGYSSTLSCWECPIFTWRNVSPSCRLSFRSHFIRLADVYKGFPIPGMCPSVKMPVRWNIAPFEQAQNKALLWFMNFWCISLSSGSSCYSIARSSEFSFLQMSSAFNCFLNTSLLIDHWADSTTLIFAASLALCLMMEEDTKKQLKLVEKPVEAK